MSAPAHTKPFDEIDVLLGLDKPHLTNADRVRDVFPTDVVGHEMVVLEETASMRRLRFANPANPSMWFDVVTFPNVLVFTGDMGDFIFRWWSGNQPDVLGYFRDPSTSYLASKVVAGVTREYSPKHAERQIREHLAETLRDADPAHDGDLIAEIRDGSLLRDLSWYIENEDALRREMDDTSRRFNEKAFADMWEWDLHDYTYHFAWALHALSHAAKTWAAHIAEAVAAS